VREVPGVSPRPVYSFAMAWQRSKVLGGWPGFVILGHENRVAIALAENVERGCVKGATLQLPDSCNDIFHSMPL
jgi:hypothetical protein